MIRVAIIEDHQLLIDALDLMMQMESAFSFVGSANNLAAGRELIVNAKPDILLLDLGLPDGNGVDLLPYIHQVSPSTRTIVLTGHSDRNSLLNAMEAGVNGYLYKGGSLTSLLTGIHKVHAGETFIPPDLMLSMLKTSHREKTVRENQNVIWENLTPREYQILVALAAGQSSDAIAANLNIATLTVRTHVRNLISKLGVHSRLEAVAFGLKHGILTRPQ